MSIKVCQREYFTEQLPEGLPLAVLQDINESFELNYKLPKQEKKMRKAMRFAQTVYVKSMTTKFAKTANILTYEKLEVDEVQMLKPLSDQLEFLLLTTDFTQEMVEKVTCLQVIRNWSYSLKLPLSSSISFMKGALNEKIKKLAEEAESAALLQFQNTKLKKEEQDRIYREIREKERAMKEADELAERQRAARRRQAAVEMMDLDLILIRRVKKISIDVPYVEGKSNLGRIFLPSWQHQHLLDEAMGGVYGLPERPELEILEFEFRVFLPPPGEQERTISLTFLFDRTKLMFILTKKIEDRLLLYVSQGGRGNLWQHDIALLKSAICRVGDKEYSTLDVFLQKSWRRLLIRHIAPLRMEPERLAFVRELRERIVYDGDVAMLRENVTPEEGPSEASSSSEDSEARRKRRRREKRLKKKKKEEREARKKRKKKKGEKGKESATEDEKADDTGGAEEEQDKESDAGSEEDDEKDDGGITGSRSREEEGGTGDHFQDSSTLDTLDKMSSETQPVIDQVS